MRFSSSVVSTLEREYHSKDQQVLIGRQRDDTGLYFRTPKEATTRSTGIVVSVFEPQYRIELAIGKAVFDCGRNSFDRLLG